MREGRTKGLTAKQRFWLEHLKACEASGQELTSYAAAHDLGVRQLYSWRSRLRRKGLLGGGDSSEPRERRRRKTPVGSAVARRPAGLGFAPVRVAREEPAFDLRIRFGNGTVLECGHSIADARLRALLAALS